MSDRIERLAKEYAERIVPTHPADATIATILLSETRKTIADAFRAGAAAGAAEERTSRSPQVEGEA